MRKKLNEKTNLKLRFITWCVQYGLKLHKYVFIRPFFDFFFFKKEFTYEKLYKQYYDILPMNIYAQVNLDFRKLEK